MELMSMEFLVRLGSIVVLDLVLAGDNAVVIAMASRRLPDELRKKAIYLGTVGAIGIRLIMTIFAVWILTIPYLQAVGGLLLLPIAAKLLLPDKEEKDIHAAAGFWDAIKTIVIADAAMGIDNVLAIAGAASGEFLLVVLGLLISVPIVVWGSQIIGVWMEKYTGLVYAGSGILAWTAGTMILHDKIVGKALDSYAGGMSMLLPLLAAIFVLGYGAYKRKNAI